MLFDKSMSIVISSIKLGFGGKKVKCSKLKSWYLMRTETIFHKNWKYNL